MKIRNFLKIFSINLFISFVLAEEKQELIGDCKEIEDYLNDKNISYKDNISKCITDSSGNIETLEVSLKSFSEDNVNKLLSYDTIKNLIYSINIDYNNKPEFDTFPKAITKLKHLEELHLNFFHEEQISPSYLTIHKSTVEKGVLKVSKSLKKLILRNIDISQDNIEDISTLSNLEELKLYNCDYVNDDDSIINLDSLNNIDTLTSLYIDYYYANHFNSDIIKNLYNIQKLTIERIDITQKNINDINEMTNLREIYINDSDFINELNDYSFKNLNNLTSINIDFNYNSRSYNNDTIKQIKLDAPKSLKKLNIKGMELTQDVIDHITTLSNLEELCINYYDESNSLKFESLKKLKDLTALDVNYYYKGENGNQYSDFFGTIDLKSFPNLKNLTLSYVEIAQTNIEEIATLTNLEEIILFKCNFMEELNFDSLMILDKLVTVEISNSQGYILEEIPNFVYYLPNLRRLVLTYNRIKTLSSLLGNLKKLEYLDLSNNNIYDEIPQSLNTLLYLKFVNFYDNRDIKGKTLTNESLEKCYYESKYDLCKSKDMTCFDDLDDIKLCTSNKTLEENSKGKCGEGYGKCPSDQCCNANGECGSGENYCLVSKGCQNEYSFCIDNCEEIRDIVNEKDNSEMGLIIEGCIVNKKGEVDKLEINNNFLSEKKIKKILSFNSITSLEYAISYNYVTKEYPVRNFPMEISDLPYLKELTFIFYSNDEKKEKQSIDDGILKVSKDLKKLSINLIKLTQKNIDEISKLTNLEELTFNLCEDYTNLNFDPLKKLIKLNTLQFIEGSYDNSSLFNTIPEFVYSLTNLKKLEITDHKIKSISDKISLLKNLEYINFQNNAITEIPNQIFELKNLKFLNLIGNKIQTIPEQIGTFKYLEQLFLSSNEITNMPEQLGNLENLVFLELSFNKIDDELPQSLNNLSKLKYLKLWGNINLTGKTLTNPNLETCYYDEGYSLCIDKDIDCLKKNDFSFKYCNTTNINDDNYNTTNIDNNINNDNDNNDNNNNINDDNNNNDNNNNINDDNDNNDNNNNIDNDNDNNDNNNGINNDNDNNDNNNGINNDKAIINNDIDNINNNGDGEIDIEDIDDKNYGKCGQEYGKCPSDQCCSKYGYCGTSSDYCDISSGCQSEFGECTNNIIKTSTVKGMCGKEYGKCPSGQCCSKYGHCGTTSEYCTISTGCQSEFGECQIDIVSPVIGRCGKDYGNCPLGKCCSKYGYCGTTADYCNATKGCQSEYGMCVINFISVSGKCGVQYGKCPSGQCCNKDGYCGTGENYCNVGCQSRFGICNTV